MANTKRKNKIGKIVAAKRRKSKVHDDVRRASISSAQPDPDAQKEQIGTNGNAKTPQKTPGSASRPKKQRRKSQLGRMSLSVLPGGEGNAGGEERVDAQLEVDVQKENEIENERDVEMETQRKKERRKSKSRRMSQNGMLGEEGNAGGEERGELQAEVGVQKEDEIEPGAEAERQRVTESQKRKDRRRQSRARRESQGVVVSGELSVLNGNGDAMDVDDVDAQVRRDMAEHEIGEESPSQQVKMSRRERALRKERESLNVAGERAEEAADVVLQSKEQKGDGQKVKRQEKTAGQKRNGKRQIQNDSTNITTAERHAGWTTVQNEEDRQNGPRGHSIFDNSPRREKNSRSHPAPDKNANQEIYKSRRQRKLLLRKFNDQISTSTSCDEMLRGVLESLDAEVQKFKTVFDPTAWFPRTQISHSQPAEPNGNTAPRAVPVTISDEDSDDQAQQAALPSFDKALDALGCGVEMLRNSTNELLRVQFPEIKRPEKRKRGRPRKVLAGEDSPHFQRVMMVETENNQKRKVGRPKKVKIMAAEPEGIEIETAATESTSSGGDPASLVPTAAVYQ